MKYKKECSKEISRRDLMRYGLYGGLATCFSSLLWTGCRQSLRKEDPNIFIITIDTLRADHLGCYGYHRNTSPNIDQFACDAVLFENCISHAPSTRMSFSSIFSGYLPHETRILENDVFVKGVDLLPEIMQEKGYKTLGVVSNYVLRKKYPAYKGFNKGFQVYDDRMNEYELVRKRPERIAKNTTSRAIELLKQYKDERLFMWIHYQDPHGPYTPPKDYTGMFVDQSQKPRNLNVNRMLTGKGGIPSYQRLGQNTDFHYYVSMYDSEIRYADDEFGRLIYTLKELKLFEDSLIIFSSDHGESLGEHNFYFCHSENLYSSLLHVPLIIKYSGSLQGRRTDSVQHIDIIPTLLNVIGRQPDPRLRGSDLFQEPVKKKEIFSEMRLPPAWGGYSTAFSIITDGMKLIYTPQDNAYRLYDIAVDPGEEKNLFDISEYQGKLTDIKLKLHRLSKEDRLNLPIRTKRHKMTEEEKRKLKSLGYLQ